MLSSLCAGALELSVPLTRGLSLAAGRRRLLASPGRLLSATAYDVLERLGLGGVRAGESVAETSLSNGRRPCGQGR